MKDHRLGEIGAIITGVSAAAFALALLAHLLTGADTAFVCYFVCMFIALGYIMFAASLATTGKGRQVTAAGIAGLAFSVVYAVFIFIVYYAMLTTVRMDGALGEETLSIISYERLGSLFFNYDLLGYGFMGLSTFFAGFAVAPKSKGDSALRALLWVHGIFFVTCFLIPMFPLFTPDMAGGDVIGTIVLLVWCAYFLPVCILGWRYFRGKTSKGGHRK